MNRTLGLAILCLAIGYGLGGTRERTASGTTVPASSTPRYAVSSYGVENQRGCYVVDTLTGELWHVGSSDRILPIGNLPPQKSE